MLWALGCGGENRPTAAKVLAVAKVLTVAKVLAVAKVLTVAKVARWPRWRGGQGGAVAKVTLANSETVALSTSSESPWCPLALRYPGSACLHDSDDPRFAFKIPLFILRADQGHFMVTEGGEPQSEAIRAIVVW